MNYLLAKDLGLSFRYRQRAGRGRGKTWERVLFLSTDEFKERLRRGFLEWEEVYPGCFYGTLKSELERI
ncbi:MAG: hypothetical protein ACLU4N_06575 [Butyricimonas faecihominis]